MPMLEQPSVKYRRLGPIGLTDRTWPDRTIDHPPIWCSVDLRDGNQALIEPMDLARKRRMFEALVKIGFKEIEAGFPSASQVEFDFIRQLIEQRLVPDDVTIQVLTQARAPLIERTFESLVGAKRVIVHLYNATAPVMRRVVFGLDKAGIVDIAVTHARLVKSLAQKQPETDWIFQYSPEMFSGTEIEFSKEVCDAVTEVWEATPQRKVILNLPATVECATPNIFGDQVEWMHRHLARRDSVVLSVHPHNDRGTGTAAAEFALMAGADRVEGCLFGNGERTGNVDLVNIALNLYVNGVAPGLDFSDIDEIRKVVEHCNQIPVHPRHPYVGDLVYTSFSGSHQDAIKKAFDARQPDEIWDMPYLPIDPKDLGRNYDAVIRVNSQSGKGGISYLLQSEYGLDLPRRLQIEFSQVVQRVMDTDGKELVADDIWNILDAEYLSARVPFEYLSHHLTEDSTRPTEVHVAAELTVHDRRARLIGQGNGPIDAFVRALSTAQPDTTIRLMDYHEHSVGAGANATAVSYVEVRVNDGDPLHGIGMDSNIVTASFKAILSALNRHLARGSKTPVRASAVAN
jgi:2-isopropylmalate synthase